MKIYKIYCIRNILNSKKYIGQTCQTFDARIKRHFYELINKKHTNRLLQRSFDKYGKENFEYFLLQDKIKNLKESNEREEYFINLYNTLNNNFGYNLIINNSKPMPEYVKKKISKTLRKNGKKNIKIVQYNIKTGEIISFWDSSNICEEKTGIRASNIIQHMNGNETYSHVGGFGFIRYSDYLINGIKSNPEFEINMKRFVPIICKNLNTGEEIRYKSITHAAKDLEIKKTEIIHRVLRGIRNRYKCWQFKYDKDK